MARIVVWCGTCDKILDEGIVDKESSLLLWNDFTKIKEHLDHTISLRLKENCPNERPTIENVQY